MYSIPLSQSKCDGKGKERLVPFRTRIGLDNSLCPVESENNKRDQIPSLKNSTLYHNQMCSRNIDIDRDLLKSNILHECMEDSQCMNDEMQQKRSGSSIHEVQQCMAPNEVISQFFKANNLRSSGDTEPTYRAAIEQNLEIECNDVSAERVHEAIFSQTQSSNTIKMCLPEISSTSLLDETFQRKNITKEKQLSEGVPSLSSLVLRRNKNILSNSMSSMSTNLESLDEKQFEKQHRVTLMTNQASMCKPISRLISGRKSSCLPGSEIPHDENNLNEQKTERCLTSLDSTFERGKRSDCGVSCNSGKNAHTSRSFQDIFLKADCRINPVNPKYHHGIAKSQQEHGMDKIAKKRISPKLRSDNIVNYIKNHVLAQDHAQSDIEMEIENTSLRTMFDSTVQGSEQDLVIEGSPSIATQTARTIATVPSDTHNLQMDTTAKQQLWEKKPEPNLCDVAHTKFGKKLESRQPLAVSQGTARLTVKDGKEFVDEMVEAKMRERNRGPHVIGTRDSLVSCQNVFDKVTSETTAHTERSITATSVVDTMAEMKRREKRIGPQILDGSSVVSRQFYSQNISNRVEFQKDIASKSHISRNVKKTLIENGLAQKDIPIEGQSIKSSIDCSKRDRKYSPSKYVTTELQGLHSHQNRESDLKSDTDDIIMAKRRERQCGPCIADANIVFRTHSQTLSQSKEFVQKATISFNSNQITSGSIAPKCILKDPEGELEVEPEVRKPAHSSRSSSHVSSSTVPFAAVDQDVKRHEKGKATISLRSPSSTSISSFVIPTCNLMSLSDSFSQGSGQMASEHRNRLSDQCSSHDFNRENYKLSTCSRGPSLIFPTNESTSPSTMIHENVHCKHACIESMIANSSHNVSNSSHNLSNSSFSGVEFPNHEYESVRQPSIDDMNENIQNEITSPPTRDCLDECFRQTNSCHIIEENIERHHSYIFPGAFAIDGVGLRNDDSFSSENESDFGNSSFIIQNNGEEFDLTLIEGQIDNDDGHLLNGAVLEAELHEELVIDGAVVIPLSDDKDDSPVKHMRLVQVSSIIFCIAAMALICVSIVNLSIQDYEEPKIMIEGWFQVGLNVFGPKDQAQSKFGSRLSLSDTGKRLAVLAPGVDYSFGALHIFEEVLEKNGSNWEPLQVINGTSESVASEMSLATSADLKTIAIGFPRLRDGGQIKLYEEQIEGGTWKAIPSPLLLTSMNDSLAKSWYGYSVDMVSDGTLLAVGAPLMSNLENGRCGAVFVFAKNESVGKWEQLGPIILGQKANEYMGYSVKIAITATGTIRLIAGAPIANDTTGLVRTFTWTGSEWVQFGADLFGSSELQRFGEAVDLSSDGSIMAIGGRGSAFSPGTVKIFRDVKGQWNSNSPVDEIVGYEAGEGFGSSVALSRDGYVLVVGAPQNSLYGYGSGTIRVYRFEDGSNKWKEWGRNIGDTPLQEFGTSISISHDGTRVAGGAPFTALSEITPRSGCVHVYAKV